MKLEFTYIHYIILNNLEIKSDSDETIRVHEMSVYRADPCINFYLDSDSEILEYLRILKKSTLIPHYHVVKFEEPSSRVKNIKEANKHLYRIKSRRAKFTAYDKIYEMLIKDAKHENKMKDRMLYLMRKTSDSSLSSALTKMYEKYNLNGNPCERILKQFDALCISPITLRNDSKFCSLPSLLSLLHK